MSKPRNLGFIEKSEIGPGSRPHIAPKHLKDAAAHSTEGKLPPKGYMEGGEGESTKQGIHLDRQRDRQIDRLTHVRVFLSVCFVLWRRGPFTHTHPYTHTHTGPWVKQYGGRSVGFIFRDTTQCSGREGKGKGRVSVARTNHRNHRSNKGVATTTTHNPHIQAQSPFPTVGETEGMSIDIHCDV